MKNRKGFTLVELLAVVVILGLMMGIAIPNIMGIIKKQKQSTYLEDAKKMISRAEYMLRSTTKVQKPTNGNCIAMTLGYLDNGEFNNPPYGGAYFGTLSYVYIRNNAGHYEYWVQLYECQTPGQKSSQSGSGDGGGSYTSALIRECNNTSGTGIDLLSSTDEKLKKPNTVKTKSPLTFGRPSVCTNTTKMVYTADSSEPVDWSSSTLSSKKDVIFDYND